VAAGCAGGRGGYDIVSFGPDGEEGSEDDITNHDRLRDEEGEISEDLDFGDMETGGGPAPGP
jgi:hypothetical protein